MLLTRVLVVSEAQKEHSENLSARVAGAGAKSEVLASVGAILAALAICAAGAFVNAFTAFVLLPIVLGLFTVWFYRTQGRRTNPARWPAILAGNALLLALLVSLGFLSFETYYRFFYDQTDAMGMTLVSYAWSARHVRTNSFGLRDNIDYNYALTPGRRRITFVGDSFTVGNGVKNVDDRFVNRIRHLHPEWEVHAAAKPGLDTSNEVELMHNLTVSNGYRLDQVVLVYQINDIGELMPGWVEGYKRIVADHFRQSWLCRNSYVVNLFYMRWLLRSSSFMQKYYDEVEAAYKGPLWARHKIAMLAFANMTRIRGGRLLIVTFPYMDTGMRFKSVHDQLSQYWKERGVPHLDLLPVFSNIPPAKLVVNAHDAHPNEYAHALAAQAIDEFLKREIPGSQ